MADDDKELLMILDEYGNPTGNLNTREYVHKNRHFHNETSIFIINGNDILLERRSMKKRLFPGTLCVPGGHVEGDDDITESAIKEAYEEVGLEISIDELHSLKRYKRVTAKQNCYQNTFYVFTDKPISYFKKQDDEVDELIYMNYEEFLEKIKEEDSDIMYNYYEEQDVFDSLYKIIKGGV